MPLPRLCISPQMLNWVFSQTNWQMIGFWLILEQHWALFLAAKMLAHLALFSKGQMGNLSPLGAHIKKTVQFQGKLFSLWLIPSWALTFKENSKSLFLQKSTKYSLLALQRPRPPTHYFQRPCPPHLFYLTRHRFQLQFQFSCPLRRLFHSLLPYP